MTRFGINMGMLPYKLFYFFSDGASSCIAPYRSLYLKQLGLSPSRIGIIAAVKPFATFVSNAMIGIVADRLGGRKWFMLTSLLVWVASLLAFGFIPPASEVSSPVARTQLERILQTMNTTNYSEEELLGRQVRSAMTKDDYARTKSHDHVEERLRTLRCIVLGCHSNSTHPRHHRKHRIPQKLYNAIEDVLNQTHHTIPSTNPPSTRSSNNTDHSIRSTTSSVTRTSTSETRPPIASNTNNNSTTMDFYLHLTNDQAVELGSDRSWLFDQRELLHLFLGVIVITNIVYIALGSFMRLADTATLNALANDPASDMSDYGWHRSFGGLGWAICSLAVGVLLSGTSTDVFRWGVTLVIINYRVAFLAFAGVATLAAISSLFMDYDYSTCDWETQWTELRRVVLSPHFGTVFFIAFFTGVCNGCIWSFLLWHFQNLGASQTLIGVLEALQSLSELILGYFCRRFLHAIGYTSALTLGLGVYALRFVCYAAITNPLWLIPVEIVHGVSFLLTWTTLVSYFGSTVPTKCLTTVQGILGALYFGLGAGVGSLSSGILIDHYGAVITFYGFAVASLIVMVLFIVAQQIFSRHVVYYDNDDDIEKKKSNLDDVSSYSEAEEIVVTTSPLIPVPVRESSQQVAGVAARFDMQQVVDSFTAHRGKLTSLDGRSRRSTRPLSCSCVLDIPSSIGLSAQLYLGDEKAGIVCSPFLEHSVFNGNHGDRKLSSISTTETVASLLSTRSRTYTID